MEFEYFTFKLTMVCSGRDIFVSFVFLWDVYFISSLWVNYLIHYLMISTYIYIIFNKVSRSS